MDEYLSWWWSVCMLFAEKFFVENSFSLQKTPQKWGLGEKILSTKFFSAKRSTIIFSNKIQTMHFSAIAIEFLSEVNVFFVSDVIVSAKKLKQFWLPTKPFRWWVEDYMYCSYAFSEELLITYIFRRKSS
jgi:hypothetical protein